MHLSLLPLLLSISAPFALADVQFTFPAAGSAYRSGQTLAITWQESGSGISLSSLSTYQLFLMAGGNDRDSMKVISNITSNGQFAQGNQAPVQIQPDLGGSETNAYFVKIVSAAAQGGTVINYSPRFTLTEMTGAFPDNIASAIKALPAGSTAGPETENTISNRQANANEPAAYTTPYALQSGATRYAPMQNIPPTKMTVKNFSPLFPTSAVNFAKQYLPTPEALTTMTLSQTFSVSSMQNTAAPQPLPSNDMQRFLNRWKD